MSKPAQQVVVYSKPGCACSMTAIELLREYGIEPQLAELSQHPDAAIRSGGVSPVVVIDGCVRFKQQIDPVLLRRCLAQMPAHAADESEAP